MNKTATETSSAINTSNPININIIKLDTAVPDYLIVRTNYTARLLGSRQEKLLEKWRASGLEEDNLDVNKQTAGLESSNILWIDNDIYVYGVDIPFTTERLVKFHPIPSELLALPHKYLEGTVCFRVMNNGEPGSLITMHEMIDMLMEVGYCGCFNWWSLYKMRYITSGDKTILFVQFDCESG